MKKIIVKTLLLLSVIAGGVSCSLDEYPYGFYSDDNFYKTPEDATAAILYAYNALTFLEYSRGIFYIGEAASETVKLKSGEDGNNPGSQALDEWSVSDNANNQTLQLYFKYCYIAINRSNAVIYNVLKSDVLEERVRKQILGEAYFLRAYSHFNLVKVFGLVPMQTQMVQTVEQARPPMAQSMDEIYTFMIEDLKQAESMMTYDAVTGRANRAAAQGLLAKLYITAASSKQSGVAKYIDMAEPVSDMYDKAAIWAKMVLDASAKGECTFGLSNNLKDIYDVSKAEGPEHVFIMSMDRSGLDEGNYSKIGMLFMPYNNGAPFYVNYGTPTLSTSYFGYEVFPTNSDFYNTYNNSDYRKTNLMNTQMLNADGSKMADSAYPFTLKYTDQIQVSDKTGDKSSIKPYLMRFSEIALLYVEAKGFDDGGWLEKIRQRAGLTKVGAGSTPEQFRDLVVQERAWEFAFEGNRLYDLRRKAMVTLVVEEAQIKNLTEAQTAFYPIPQRETDLNPSI